MTQQHPGWPQQPASSGRLVASIIAGGILGLIAGAFVPVLNEAALARGYTRGAGSTIGLTPAWLITMPLGGLLGALWGMRRARRPRQPIDTIRRPNQVIRRDRGNGAA